MQVFIAQLQNQVEDVVVKAEDKNAAFVALAKDYPYKAVLNIQKACGYIAYYKGKRIELYAITKFGAQCRAAVLLKAKKAYDVAVVLAEVDGVTYNNVADF